MRCISPLSLKTGLTVPCGHCNFCLANRRADWSFRLYQENKVSQSSHFLTLTYDDSTVPHGDDCLSLCKTDLQLFTKRLRKENGPKLRYYSVGEYGTETDRPHYHSIMFGLDVPTLSKITDIWQKGNVHVGDVNAASIHYVTKYVINRSDMVRGREPPFALMSRRPGIGANYLETHQNYHRDAMRYYSRQKGIYSRLPRYFKDKFFSADERREMAETAEFEAVLAYRKEITRLEAIHNDPHLYHAERVNRQHDLMSRTINSKNKF